MKSLLKDNDTETYLTKIKESLLFLKDLLEP